MSNTIAAVLLDFPDLVLMSLEDPLKVLGAVTADDLKYITEGDLLSVLKPYKPEDWMQPGPKRVSVKHYHHNTAHLDARMSISGSLSNSIV